MRPLWAILLLAAMLTGCGSAENSSPSFRFSRMGGVLENVQPSLDHPITVSCGKTAQQVPTQRIEKKLLLSFEWTPERPCTIRWGNSPDHQLTVRAPLVADPVPVLTIDLESIFPDQPEFEMEKGTSFLNFSPTGRYLAIGTERGAIQILHLETGRSVLQIRVPEGRARAAVFSPDEKILFIGEQSREAFLRAIEFKTGREIWHYRLADDLGDTRPWNPGDKLAWVLYPAPYRMATTPDGDLLVAALHNWYPQKGSGLRQLSHLYRFNGKTGAVRWKWPSGDPAPLALTWFSTDRNSRTAVGILGTPRSDLESLIMHPGLYALNLKSGDLQWKYEFSPFQPHFRTVRTWRGVAVRPDRAGVGASTNDGRLYFLREGELERMDPRGGPVFVSGLPVVTETGSIGATEEYVIFVLGSGYIPFQAGPRGASANHPHPNANTLFLYDWDGNPKRRWQAPNRSNGMAMSEDGRWVALALSKSRLLRRDDVNGLILFDMKTSGRNFYAGEFLIEGAVPFDQIAMNRDGTLISLVEIPAAIDDGRPPSGRFRLHVLY